MVIENDETVKVPIMYSNPERWNTIQKAGYLVDNKKQLINLVFGPFFGSGRP